MLGAATIGGTFCCGMCGYEDFHIVTLFVGEVYDCPGCKRPGMWGGAALAPVPWWWAPRGALPALWLAAMWEVHLESPMYDEDPPRFVVS